MNPEKVRLLLEQVAGGQTSVADAVAALRSLPYEQMTDATIDHHRALRQGCPEVIYAEQKTDEQVLAITAAILESGQNVLATRVMPSAAHSLIDRYPEAQYSEKASTVRIERNAIHRREVDPVAVISAGTSDTPVAEEAVETLEAVGIPVQRVYDVGVAGLHRLLGRTDTLQSASVVIVVAGMEGALPSVVGGLVARPVIAVPTAVGYGAALGGFAALMGMLSSCASGVVVVNIDNGFGAAMAAHRILLGAPPAETDTP